MNSYKLNSTSNYILKRAIADSLNIEFKDVYKTVLNIDFNKNLIYTKDCKIYKIELIEIKH